MKWAKYRIVDCAYSGFECQEWLFLFPFWRQIGIKTFRTVEDAEAYIRQYTYKPKVVKYVDVKKHQLWA